MAVAVADTTTYRVRNTGFDSPRRVDLPAAVGAVAEGVISPDNLVGRREATERRKGRARNEKIKVDPSEIVRPFVGQTSWN